MSNDYFRFKQFVVHQSNAAMKVGTDGCLLGALAEGGEHILDIGTGTGVVALMMAQRNPAATVDAVEIDDHAVIDASANFAQSPFAGRLSLHHSSLQAFTADKQYDSIVCNPPYYDASLTNPDESRTTARHTEALSFTELCNKVFKLLAPYGAFTVILPTESLKLFTAEACIAGFVLEKHISIKTVSRKPARRHILKLCKVVEGEETIHEEHTIMNDDGTRSEFFTKLMSDFYL